MTPDPAVAALAAALLDLEYGPVRPQDSVSDFSKRLLAALRADPEAARAVEEALWDPFWFWQEAPRERKPGPPGAPSMTDEEADAFMAAIEEPSPIAALRAENVRLRAVEAAAREAADWLEAEAAHPRPLPGPAMDGLARRLRAALDAAGEGE